MWDQTVKSCRDLLMQGEAALIKQFQGALFVKIPDKYKADIINEYIEDQE